MSYAVAQRSQELGIRLALGASPGSLRRMVMGNVLRLALVGVLAGAPLAVAAGCALRDVLFGVGPLEPAVVAAASGVIVLVAVVAGWGPASRVTRLDPVTTIRAE
jgi:ABC-type antimicrobial peptide transport system permease subunit